MNYTARRKLGRDLIKSIRLWEVWDGPELRDRNDALRERNDALLTAKRQLNELIKHNDDEIAANLARMHAARDRKTA